MGVEGGEIMKGKVLKDWASKLPDDCIVEVKKYSWEDLDPGELRAIMTCTLPNEESMEKE